MQGTGLLWVNNTDSDVFRMGKTGPVYYLVAGRWFRRRISPGLDVCLDVAPADFKKFRSSTTGRVCWRRFQAPMRPSKRALAEIPQTARVNKKETKAPDVAFQGDPQFTPIEPTTVQRAVNRQGRLQVRRQCYMCYQGVVRRQERNRSWEVKLGAAGDL